MIAFQRIVLQAETLGYLFSLVVGVSLVCGAGLVMTSACRKRSAPLRHAMLCSVLTLVLISPVVSWLAGQHDLGVLRMPVSISPHHQTAAQSAVAVSAPSPQAGATPWIPMETSLPDEPPLVTPRPGVSVDADLVQHVPPLPSRAGGDLRATPAWQWAGTLAAYAWAIGIFWGVASLGRGWLLLSRLCRSFEPVRDPRSNAAAREAAGALGVRQVPPLVTSLLAPAPLSIGLFRPVIVLPQHFETETDAGRLQAVLVHEMAHVARRDQWMGLMQRVVGMLFWWNPLVHRVSARLCDLREEIADNYVVRAQDGGELLARLLVEFAERTAIRPRLLAAIGVLQPRPGDLAGRITRLLDKERNTMTRINLTSVPATASLVLVLAGVLVVSSVRADRPPESEQPEGRALASAGVPALASVVEETDETTPLETFKGRVIDEEGKPVAGAELWMPLRVAHGREGRRMVHGASGDDGRFVLRYPAAWVKPGDYRPERTLWAFSPGRLLGSADVLEARSDLTKEVAVTLGPPVDTSFTVVGPDKKPVAGALVEPWSYGHGGLPSEVLPRVGGRTDDEGRIKLPALRRRSLRSVRVTTEALGIQCFEIPKPPLDGDEPEERTLQLAPTGRIEARLLAERPELLDGAEVYVVGDYRMSAEDRRRLLERPPAERTRPVRGFAEVSPDKDGRFVVPKFATGKVLISVHTDPSLPLRPRLPFGTGRSPEYVRVEAGKVTRVEIPLEKAVRVRGVVRVKQTNEPIVGALAVVSYGVQSQTELVRTNEQGKFEAYALPGEVTRSVMYLPDDVVRPGELGELFQVYKVPPGAESFEFPPIEVVPAVAIHGRVIDESDRPLSDVQVSGTRGNRRYGLTMSDKDGRFTMRVPPDVEFEEFSTWSLEAGRSVEHTVVTKDPLLLRVLDQSTRKQPSRASAEPRSTDAKPDMPEAPGRTLEAIAKIATVEEAVAALEEMGARLERNDQGQVTSVGLFSRPGREITDAHVVCLRLLGNLEKLLLTNTHTSSRALEYVQEPKRLRKLIVGRETTDEGLDILRTMTNLQELNFSYKKVGDTTMQHLEGLENLESLWLGRTDVTDAGLESLRALTKIRELGLPPAATDKGLACLAGLTNLERLNVSDTQITDAGLAHLEGFNKVWMLMVANVNVTDAGLAHLSGLTNIERLTFEGTQITDAGLTHLQPFTKLVALGLSRTAVTDAGLIHLHGFKDLWSLRLVQTAVGDKGLTQLTKLPTLERLNLARTQVTDAGLEHLKGMTQLRELTIGEPGVTEAGSEDLRSALPDCTIRWSRRPRF